MNLLKTIAKSGHYKNRIFIAERINQLSDENKLQLIEILLNDSIEKISQLAIRESEKLILKKAFKLKVHEKSEYWVNKRLTDEKRKAKNKELLKNSTNSKRKFSNGESYQNMKNMLKKPMNTGKWL
jgi:hypothetical protein